MISRFKQKILCFYVSFRGNLLILARKKHQNGYHNHKKLRGTFATFHAKLQDESCNCRDKSLGQMPGKSKARELGYGLTATTQAKDFSCFPERRVKNGKIRFLGFIHSYRRSHPTPLVDRNYSARKVWILCNNSLDGCAGSLPWSQTMPH